MSIDVAAYRGYLAGHLDAAAALIDVALKDARENLERNPSNLPTILAIQDLEQAIKLVKRQMRVVYPVEMKGLADG